jgi:hypothetical protein
MCGMLYEVATFAAKVPLPAPGGPKKMNFIFFSYLENQLSHCIKKITFSKQSFF